MLELQNIGVKRDDWVLRDINLSIKEGEMIGVIGKSGAGKTTLLKTMAALLDPVEGKVFFKGQRLIGPSDKLVPGYEDIQLVDQDFALETYHTVEENIREKILNLTKDVQKTFVEELLLLMELEAIRNRQARYLSGGEKQRLCIARALASEPDILLMDEPFVHLDQRIRLKVIRYILEQRKKFNMTIIIVSHDGSELLGFADRVIHIQDGRVEREADLKAMYYYPESLEQAELMGPVNRLVIDGKEELFRPNEYKLSEEGTNAKMLRSVDTGMVVYNYVGTDSGEELILASKEPLPSVFRFLIQKK